MAQLEASPQDSARARRRRPMMARRLAIAFGSVSIVAVAMCGMLLTSIYEVSGLVDTMSEDEVAIKEGLTLAMAVREQYTHQAHWLIERGEKHVAYSAQWREQIVRGVQALQEHGTCDDRTRLARIESNSAALDALFTEDIQPAAQRGDIQAVQRHHKKALELSQLLATDADAVARSVEHQMARVHEHATVATQLGLMGGMVCVLLVLGLSVAHTVRLRHVVLDPLHELTRAARRFGAGDFDSRVGDVGDGEFGDLASAFDRMVAELGERQRKLVKSERMAVIGQLAAGVAHEINNPIGIIRGYLKTMDASGSRETLRDELKILDEEAASCQRIAEGLLSFSRSAELRPVAADMAQLLSETARRFGEKAEAKNVELQVDVDEGQLVGDVGRLRQVVLNLLVNAAQSCALATSASEGGPDRPGVITLTGERLGDGGYAFAVLDNGPGISREDLPRIFEPFFSQRAEGTGLGLAVCRSIIEAHGGTIVAENRPEGGAVFRVSIPAQPQPESGGTL